MAFDKSKFIEGFKVEMREHLQALSLGLIKLEKAPQDFELLNTLMREAHTIKGSATMMGYQRIADIGHCMEDGLERALHKEIVLEKSHFNAIFSCLDVIEPLLEDKVTWKGKGLESPFVDQLCRDTRGVFFPSEAAAVPSLKMEGVHPAKPAVEESVPFPEGSLRVDLQKLDHLMNLSGELIIARIRLSELVKSLIRKVDADSNADEALHSLVKDFEDVDHRLSFLSQGVQTDVMGVRMLPVSSLFNTFPRGMRDLALSKGKEISFELKGEDTLLDKTILDALKAPLMHLLRNSVDHGIESPQERSERKKSKEGRIVLSAFQQGSQVVIEVWDDGRGVDTARVRELTVEKGLFSAKQIAEMSEDQVIELIFNSGFSTKTEVSETSGRGVGLDVVRNEVAKLKGLVDVTSVAGAGTKFLLRLPLTLAITESLLVSAGPDLFAIPIDAVLETTRIEPQLIKTVESKEAVTVRGRILPLVRIADLFGLSRKGVSEKKFFSLVIVQAVDKRVALLIDELVGRQKIVAKNIGEPLGKIRNISGGTILGDGRVILILDIPSIIDSAEGVIAQRPTLAPATKTKVRQKRTILLAEDTLSTAMLEKNVLESVGYSVVIARDGKEALDRAGQEKFDLVITDVLMPRMDGFELTGRLKKDSLYKDIPVIIVTTRETDADKRRGMEAGADAYILKKDFTSEGLLETIERLLG